MIVYHTTAEIADAFTAGILPFELARDMVCAVPPNDENGEYIEPAEYEKITEKYIAWIGRQNINLVEKLGGSAYICTNFDDLLQVEGMDFEFSAKHDRWPNVTELPLSWDQVEVIQTSLGKFCVFFLATNDAGGALYYVPESLFAAAKVEEHLELNNANN